VANRRLKKILGHVIVERTLGVAHRILVQPAAPLRERPVEKLLGLPAQGPLKNNRETPLKLVLLATDQRSIILVAKDLAKCGNVAE
jgi:hypothetical protein